MYKKYNKPAQVDNKPKLIVTATYQVKESMQLLDFLIANMKSQSRNNIKSILKNRCVLVDGVTTTQFDYQLTKKQLVQISKSPMVKTASGSSYKLDIIYEDDEFIVINKPHGLLSIATDKENEKTAYHYVMEYVRKNSPKNQIFVVHRLDKETSGVLMFAKNSQIRDKLQDVWNDIVKTREYYAVVEGIFEKKKDTIKSYLTETKTHIVFSSRGKTGKLSITNYEVIKESKTNSLVKVNIDSGRKNQIRVHLSEAGHPVLGDYKYGESIKKEKRLYLHASMLEFVHPVNKTLYTFKAKVPNDFYNIVR